MVYLEEYNPGVPSLRSSHHAVFASTRWMYWYMVCTCPLYTVSYGPAACLGKRRQHEAEDGMDGGGMQKSGAGQDGRAIRGGHLVEAGSRQAIKSSNIATRLQVAGL
jgi:hypothetical protein